MNEINDVACSTSNDDPVEVINSNNPLEVHQLKLLARSDPYLDSLLDTLKQQLLLHSASPEEVAARRRRWLEVSVAVQGVTSWPGFSSVFMVSSANGDGIDRLRVSSWFTNSSCSNSVSVALNLWVQVRISSTPLSRSVCIAFCDRSLYTVYSQFLPYFLISRIQNIYVYRVFCVTQSDLRHRRKKL